jgi:hypothetical protein
MLVQNFNNTIGHPIYYTSQLKNNAQKNYTTIKKEVLAMIYVVKKFCHYLLANTFIFFVGHQALLHQVNKHVVTSWIAKWLLFYDAKA